MGFQQYDNAISILCVQASFQMTHPTQFHSQSQFEFLPAYARIPAVFSLSRFVFS